MRLGRSGGFRRNEDTLDALVELAFEEGVRLSGLLERKAVTDDALCIDAPGTDVLEQMRHIPLAVGLVHSQGQAFVHRRSDVDRVVRRTVDTDDDDVATLSHRRDAPVD